MISRAQIKKNVRNQLIFHIASAVAAIKFVCFCSCTGGGGGGVHYTITLAAYRVSGQLR